MWFSVMRDYELNQFPFMTSNRFKIRGVCYVQVEMFNQYRTDHEAQPRPPTFGKRKQIGLLYRAATKESFHKFWYCHFGIFFAGCVTFVTETFMRCGDVLLVIVGCLIDAKAILARSFVRNRVNPLEGKPHRLIEKLIGDSLDVVEIDM